MSQENITSVWCSNCGRDYRKHKVLFQHKVSFGNEDEGWTHDQYHQLVQCLGCETVRYHRYFIEKEYNPPDHLSDPYCVEVFPNDEAGADLRKPLPLVNALDNETPLVPENVRKMYRETVDCLNVKSWTLAGGGLRAVVEAICLSQNIINKSLQKKIDELAKNNLLTKSQAELLHEERYLGNSALHEMTTPTRQDIEDGLEIVEGLINTIYILPSKAKALQERRTARSNPKATKSP